MAKQGTLNTDVFMSIKPDYMKNMALGRKNYEYRKYRLPASIGRIWFYTSTPDQHLRYVADVSSGRQPGQVLEDGGIGNREFNAGLNESKYGYEILALWKLSQPLSLQELKQKGYLKGPPQKYCWVTEEMKEDVESSLSLVFKAT